MSMYDFEEILIDHVECSVCQRVVDCCDAKPVIPHYKRGEWICDMCAEAALTEAALFDDVAAARMCARFGTQL